MSSDFFCACKNKLLKLEKKVDKLSLSELNSLNTSSVWVP